MTVEENKEFVLSWFELALKGDTEGWAELMHDDFRYYSPGNMPLSGWRDKAGFLETAALLVPFMAGPLTLKVGTITAEDDRVLFEAESDMQVVGGKHYNNVYVMAVRIRDGKVLELKEFSDTLHVYQTFDAPAMRGEPRPRETPVEHVTRTLGGAPGALGGTN
jgi:ketosteroid isomerase-like protein